MTESNGNKKYLFEMLTVGVFGYNHFASLDAHALNGIKHLENGDVIKKVAKDGENTIANEGYLTWAKNHSSKKFF